ncbi:MAG: DUF4349 domain-containing protein [Actinomycetota bacterium]|nr:DUF4349 domain-containing protein [Actinomycetota bacterium]
MLERQLVGIAVAPAAPIVIRTGTVTLAIARRRLVRVFDRVSSVALDRGGFVASSSSGEASGANGASLTLRVPSAGFSNLVARIDTLGRVEAQQETGQDVTGAVVDLGARIANLKSEEAALRTLLSRAGSIAAVLQVQDQLFGVEGEIQQMGAAQGSFVDRATYATLSVHLMALVPSTPKPVVDGLTP